MKRQSTMPPSKTRTWFWLFALALAAAASIVLAQMIAFWLSLDVLAASAVLQALLLTSVLLIARNDGLGTASLRLRFRWERGDLWAVAALFVIQYIGSLVAAVLLQSQIDVADLKASSLLESLASFGPAEFLFIAVGVTVLVGVSEELLFRGYVISRLEASGVPTVGAVLVSAALFGLVHWGGYGWILSISKALSFGLPSAIYFVRHRKLLPIVVAHVLVNLFGFILAYVSGLVGLPV